MAGVDQHVQRTKGRGVDRVLAKPVDRGCRVAVGMAFKSEKKAFHTGMACREACYTTT